jgi:hypothetical protein
MLNLQGVTMHLNRFVATFAVAAILTGCAHPLVITPDVAKLEAPAKTVPHKAVVGYYLSEEQRAQEVITPGGGRQGQLLPLSRYGGGIL